MWTSRPAGIYLGEPKFDDAFDFKEGFALVELDGKYGFIKSDGTYLVEPRFEDACSFHEGIAEVVWQDEEGYIDTEGNFTSYLD